MSRKKSKTEGFAFILYPDSMRKGTINWLLQFFPCAISPLHNRDKKEDGTLKKAHYHVLIQGKLSAEWKRYITDRTQQFYFEPVESMYKYYHYLYHWDTSTNWYIYGKAQYWKGDVKIAESFNTDYLRFTFDKFDYFRLCLNKINTNHIYEWCDFINSVVFDNDVDLLDYVMSNQFLIRSYIDSCRYKYLAKINT